MAKIGTITIKFYGPGEEGEYMFVTPRKYSQWEIDKAMEGA